MKSRLFGLTLIVALHLTAAATPALPPLLHGNAAQNGLTSEEEPKKGIVRDTTVSESLDSFLNHSEHLPPVLSGFKQGSVLSEEHKPLSPCTGLWFRVPKWAIGQWQSTEKRNLITEVDYVDCFSARRPLPPDEEDLLRVGHEQDLTGQTWHFECIPSSGLDQLKPSANVILIPQEALMQQFANSWKVVFRERFIVVQLQPDAVPATIMHTEQHEYLVIFSHEDGGKMKVSESEKIFDQAGNPLRLLEAKRVCSLAQPFAATTEPLLVSSFEQFLKSNNMTDRIPKHPPHDTTPGNR